MQQWIVTNPTDGSRWDCDGGCCAYISKTISFSDIKEETMSTEIRLVIADDHPLLRNGLRQVIESDSRLKVLAEAGDGEAALEHIEVLRPDVAVLDIEMPRLTGFDLLRAISEKKLAVEVVFLTMYKDEEMFNEALDLGA